MEITTRRDAILAELRKLGIAQLEVEYSEYSGSGDSGQIDTICAFTAHDLVELTKPNARVYEIARDVDVLVEAHYGDEGQLAIRVSNKLLGAADKLLSDILEKFAYDLLDYFDVPDWGNNDGGEGTITIYVDGDANEGYEPGHILCDHKQNETIQHESRHEL